MFVAYHLMKKNPEIAIKITIVPLLEEFTFGDVKALQLLG